MFGLIFKLVSLLCSLVWFLSNFAIFLIHYFFVLLIVSFFVSKIYKLKPAPFPKIFEPINSWCIAFYGANFDAPECSRASIDYSISKNCPRVFLPISMTSDGHLVILDEETLALANIHSDISKLSLDELKSFNISQNHPLGAQYGEQKVLTLDCLVKIVEPLNDDFFVLLHVKRANNVFIEKLKQAIATHEPLFTKKFILCCNSPIAIYKLRKIYSNLMCAIWMDNLSHWRSQKRIYRFLNILRSIYDVILRNLITPIIGVNLVFIHKDEFNTHISELWQNYNVIPIVYFVNSPSEKRYYQNTIKTRYLTNSLRSEPQIIFNSIHKS